MGTALAQLQTLRCHQLTGAVIQRNASAALNAAPYHYENNGDTASVQFQSYPSGSALFCIKLLLMQVDADVYGRVAYVKFTWNPDRALNDDFDETMPNLSVITLYDGNVVDDFGSADAYGFYGAAPLGGEWESEPIKVSIGRNKFGPAPDGGSFLPKNSANPNTGDAVLCFPDCRVADLSAVTDAKLYYTTNLRPESMCYFTNNVTNATVQIQGNTRDDGTGAQICVKVEFTDGVGGVYARAVYAKYDWGRKYQHDFDVLWEGAMNIYSESTQASGYGVKNIIAEFKGSRVTFGASALTLDREITGDGTVRFAPLSGSQTVTVPAARTLGDVAFGGATAFSFAEGASLSVGSAEVEDAAAVSVSDENLLRIGTSKCLTKEQCEHFTVKGSPAAQNDGGWMVQKPGLVLIFR